MKRTLSLFAAICVSACVSTKGDPEILKPSVDVFYQSIRWKDFHKAAELLVTEKQAAFIKARLKNDDERDLTITNYELETAILAPDLMSAQVITRINWFRLPSSTEQTAVVTNVFVWRNGAWLLESQDDGPFEELKPAPEKPAAE